MKQIRLVSFILFVSIVLAGNVLADDLIKSAMTAAPGSISAKATVMDWNFKILRQGNNGWTCLPDSVMGP